jgi:cobalt-precorrin-6B (C15)-methyltransferase
MRWIKDEEFIRGNVPMTKFEVRMVTMAVLGIESGDVFLDIGAGTGSVSIEAALQGAKVYAVEMDEEGIELINKNCQKFKVEMKIIKGKAPEGLKDIPFIDKCFIGGSGRALAPILEAVDSKLKNGGICVANFVTLKNLNEFQSLLENKGYLNIDTKLIQASTVDRNTGILKSQNPVFIVKGEKP